MLIYNVAGFGLGGAGIWFGIRANWREVINVATGFLLLFLYAKCFDWWWNWLPRYLFFLLLGGLAVAVLLVLGRFRHGRGGVTCANGPGWPRRWSSCRISVRGDRGA